MHEEYKDFQKSAVEIAEHVGSWLREQFGEKIQTRLKADDSVVTELDLAAEKIILEQIKRRYPDHQVLGEELSPHQLMDHWTWVVDPIDGTRNFALGIPMWAVSVALMENGEPVAAAIHLPVTNETYHASKGNGAWLNKHRIDVGQKEHLKDAIASTDLLPIDYAQRIPPLVLQGIFMAVRRTRMLGSVCCGMCYVASGKLDLYYRPEVNVWDVAAGVLIVREAGGEVRAFDGKDWDSRTSSILVANSTLVQKFLDLKSDLNAKYGFEVD